MHKVYELAEMLYIRHPSLADRRAWNKEGNTWGSFFLSFFKGHITDISKLRCYFYIKTKVGISWRKIHMTWKCSPGRSRVVWVMSADGGTECAGGAPEFPLPLEVLQWENLSSTVCCLGMPWGWAGDQHGLVLNSPVFAPTIGIFQVFL